MIKLVYCVRRHPDVTPEAFRRYWLEQHGARVRRLAPALGARRYVQSHTLETPQNAAIAAGRGTRPAYDGVTELWWDSLDALQAALSTDAGRAADRELREDESGFIDLSDSSVFLTEEHEIF